VCLLLFVYVGRGSFVGCAMVSSKFCSGWRLGYGGMVSPGINDNICILFGFSTCLGW
jgi:hypothetical protein